MTEGSPNSENEYDDEHYREQTDEDYYRLERVRGVVGAAALPEFGLTGTVTSHTSTTASYHIKYCILPEVTEFPRRCSRQ